MTNHDFVILRISIHSPLAGRDRFWWAWAISKKRFQSTRPSRGETAWRRALPSGIPHFNPLAPRGARPTRSGSWHARWIFQSTRPSRGETEDRREEDDGPEDFNPLAPRGARPGGEPAREHRDGYFNPLAPRGARHLFFSLAFTPSLFQSTRPSRGETAIRKVMESSLKISIHSPLAGRDPGTSVA